MNQYQTLHGPLVIMPQNKRNQNQHNNDNKEKIYYSCLIQIQDLNPLFSQNTNISNQQPKGSIFIILLQQIPQNYEVVLSVSNSFAISQTKELNIGINNKNPIAIIPWPLPGIGRAVSFQIHCTLRPTQQQLQRITYGIGNLFNTSNNQQNICEQKSNDNNIGNDSGLWNIGGGKMVMMIYSGKQTQNNRFGGNNNNENRLPWINVFVQNNSMTFYDLCDSACAQLGLPPPAITKTDNDQQNQQPRATTDLWGGFQINPSQNNKKQYYVVRNQMGHQCGMEQNVIKYLDKMVMNSNLFPVFIFTTCNKPSGAIQQRQQQRQQRQQQQRGGAGGGDAGGLGGLGGFPQFNFGAGTTATQPNPFQWTR